MKSSLFQLSSIDIEFYRVKLFRYNFVIIKLKVKTKQSHMSQNMLTFLMNVVAKKTTPPHAHGPKALM